MNELNIRDADKLEITILMDNYTDLLVTGSTDICRRPQVLFPQILFAEHGFSCLIKVYAEHEEHVVLMDAAVTSASLFSNAEVLKADLGKIEAIALSHGHPDHFLGLVGLLKSLSKNERTEFRSSSITTPFSSAGLIFPQSVLSQCLPLMNVS
jgi:7,8-dihydropterin-6-yl-methyl-4-(beta-D-ribofuranosyl)aminobenzene 5'-phosphate synthase